MTRELALIPYSVLGDLPTIQSRVIACVEENGKCRLEYTKSKCFPHFFSPPNSPGIRFDSSLPFFPPTVDHFPWNKREIGLYGPYLCGCIHSLAKKSMMRAYEFYWVLPPTDDTKSPNRTATPTKGSHIRMDANNANGGIEASYNTNFFAALAI